MATAISGVGCQAGFVPASATYVGTPAARPKSAVPALRNSNASLVQRLDSARGLSVCNVAGRESCFVCGEGDFLQTVGFGLESPAGVVMAVPKKKTSRTKTKQRRAKWYAQGRVAAAKAYSLAKSVLTQRGSFIYSKNSDKKKDSDEEDESEE